MPLLNKRKYEKKEPFRDATLYIIICEGEKREPEYFRFFDGLTSQLKLVIVPSSGGRSAPNHLITEARNKKNNIVNDEGDYELWFILDLDKWQNQLHRIHQECRDTPEWNLSISNPCFEVWLYYHFSKRMPRNGDLSRCSIWRQLIPSLVNGGFNSNHHPTLIFDAIGNSRQNYSENGYIPNTGSTQIFILAEKIYTLTKKTILKFRTGL